MMRKVLISLIACPITIILVIMEWLLKLGMKLSTVVVGLFFNVILVCMIIAVCNKQWQSVGLLIIIALIGLAAVYGNATLLYLIGEMRQRITKWRGV